MAAAAAAELPGKYQKLAQEYSKVPGPGRGGEAVPQPRGAEVPVPQRGAFPSDTCKAVLWSDKGAEGCLVPVRHCETCTFCYIFEMLQLPEPLFCYHAVQKRSLSFVLQLSACNVSLVFYRSYFLVSSCFLWSSPRTLWDHLFR